MSAFKDAVSRDVKAVFINSDEFAYEHDLNGQKVACIVDKDLTTEAKDTISQPLEGVFLNILTIYVDVKDIERQPVEGEILELDGVMHIVRSVSVEEGILVIVAEVNEQ
jgi:hypothetical protein